MPPRRESMAARSGAPRRSRLHAVTTLILVLLIPGLHMAEPDDAQNEVALLNRVAIPSSHFISDAEITTTFRVLSSDPGVMEGVEVTGDTEIKELVGRIRSSFAETDGERIRSSLVRDGHYLELTRTSLDGLHRVAAFTKESPDLAAQPLAAIWSNARGHAFQFPGDFAESRLAVVCKEESLDIMEMVFAVASRKLDSRFRELLERKNLDRYRSTGSVMALPDDRRLNFPSCDLSGRLFQVFRYVSPVTSQVANSQFAATPDSFSTLNAFDGDHGAIMSWIWADIREHGDGPALPQFGALLSYRVSTDLLTSGQEFSYQDGTHFSLYLVSSQVAPLASTARADSLLPVAGQEFEYANVACGTGPGNLQVDPDDFGKSLAEFPGNPFSNDPSPSKEPEVRRLAQRSSNTTGAASGFGLKGQVLLGAFGLACILLGWALRGRRK